MNVALSNAISEQIATMKAKLRRMEDGGDLQEFYNEAQFLWPVWEAAGFEIAVLVANAKAPAWKPGRPVKRGKVTVDRAAGVVRIGKNDAEIVDVVDALRTCGVIT